MKPGITRIKYFFTWLLSIKPAAKVTAKQNPYGISYIVAFADQTYESSADGTLWFPVIDGIARCHYPGWRRTEQCRRAVRRAMKNGLKPASDPKWDILLDKMLPNFRNEFMAGVAKGRKNAESSGLLP